MPPDLLPTVAVIVPIYNGAADLLPLLDCLEQQIYPRQRVAYWLVDNGSRDRTPQLLAVAQQRAIATGLPLCLAQQTQIQSAYAARNAGIRASTSELLAFTDVDCRPQPDWLMQLVTPFAIAHVGLVAGEILGLPGSSLLERYAAQAQTLSQRHTLQHPFRPYGQTANLAVRRQVFSEVGLFRPYLTSGGDADLCWRSLATQTWELQLAAEAIVYHRHRRTLGDLAAQWRRYGASNRYLHELYTELGADVPLMRPITWRDYAYRSGRWLLKELPEVLPALLSGTAGLELGLKTPLDLYCATARWHGQQNSKLPPNAHQIEYLF